MVLITPKWIHRASWSESKAFLDLPRDTIRHSPECTDRAPLSCDYETQLHHHYKRLGDWANENVEKEKIN